MSRRVCDYGHSANGWVNDVIPKEKESIIKETIQLLLNTECAPHSEAWCSATECPRCLAEDLQNAVQQYITFK